MPSPSHPSSVEIVHCRGLVPDGFSSISARLYEAANGIISRGQRVLLAGLLGISNPETFKTFRFRNDLNIAIYIAIYSLCNLCPARMELSFLLASEFKYPHQTTKMGGFTTWLCACAADPRLSSVWPSEIFWWCFQVQNTADVSAKSIWQNGHSLALKSINITVSSNGQKTKFIW